MQLPAYEVARLTYNDGIPAVSAKEMTMAITQTVLRAQHRDGRTIEPVSVFAYDGECRVVWRTTAVKAEHVATPVYVVEREA